MTLRWLFRAIYTAACNRNTARIARIDGSGDPPIPHWDADQLPPHCWKLVYTDQKTLHETEQQWKAEDVNLHPRWETAFHEAGQADEQLTTDERDTEAAEAAYKTFHGGKDAPPSDRRSFIYWLVTGIWAILEVPFSAVAFRCLGDSDLLIYIVTFIVSSGIVYAGHCSGKALRHVVKAPEENPKFSKGLVILLVAVNMAVLAGVAFFRARYLAVSATAVSSPPPRLGFHDAGEIATTAVQSAPIGETMAMIVFFVFGLLLFVNVVVFSFYRHDPALDTVFRRRRNVKKAWKHKNQIDRQLAKAKAKREKRHGHYSAEAGRVIASLRSRTELYKTVNLQVRRDRAQSGGRYYPLCFDQHGQLTTPEALVDLEWSTALAAPSRKGTAPQDDKAEDHKASGHKAEDHKANAAGSAVPLALNDPANMNTNGHQPSATSSHR